MGFPAGRPEHQKPLFLNVPLYFLLGDNANNTIYGFQNIESCKALTQPPYIISADIEMSLNRNDICGKSLQVSQGEGCTSR